MLKDQLDGLDVYAGKFQSNFVFDRYISTKTELEAKQLIPIICTCMIITSETVFERRKIGEIKYSRCIVFYYHLINERKLQVNTLETIHTVLHPTFQLAVRDDIIRNNPSHGVMSEIKRNQGGIME